MKKDTYRSIHINELDVQKHREVFCDRELVIGLDVAKHEMYAGLGTPEGDVKRIVYWTHPDQSRCWMDTIQALEPSSVTMVLEPTGTYGDAIAAEADRRNWDIQSVQPKRVKDAAEVYDGVPSQHDAKAAELLVWLYSQGLSREQRQRSDLEKKLRCLVEPLEWLRKDKQRYEQRLSSKLARYWPEVLESLETDSATLLGIVGEYGGPRAIANEIEAVQKKMRDIGGHRLKTQTIQQVITGAQQTLGEPMVPEEQRAMKTLAKRVDQLRVDRRDARRRVTQMVKNSPEFNAIRRLGEVIGNPTAAIMWNELGDFRNYDAPKQLIKAMGLNLKEKSSGKHQGQLKITKRGSSKAREVLYLAVWRKINRDPWFGRWHEEKVQREGNQNKNKSVVALMRKLAKGLWHVARGKQFESSKLFADDLLKRVA